MDKVHLVKEYVITLSCFYRTLPTFIGTQVRVGCILFDQSRVNDWELRIKNIRKKSFIILSQRKQSEYNRRSIK